jgi:hypothetical protein
MYIMMYVSYGLSRIVIYIYIYMYIMMYVSYGLSRIVSRVYVCGGRSERKSWGERERKSLLETLSPPPYLMVSLVWYLLCMYVCVRAYVYL